MHLSHNNGKRDRYKKKESVVEWMRYTDQSDVNNCYG